MNWLYTKFLLKFRRARQETSLEVSCIGPHRLVVRTFGFHPKNWVSTTHGAASILKIKNRASEGSEGGKEDEVFFD